MIIDILLLISGICMFVALISGNIKIMVLILFFAFFLTTFIKDEDKKYNSNRSYHKPTLNPDFFESTKCFHIKSDCEECFSQSVCNIKDENIVEKKEEEHRV